MGKISKWYVDSWSKRMAWDDPGLSVLAQEKGLSVFEKLSISKFNQLVGEFGILIKEE